MLCRSGKGDELLPHIQKIILNSNTKFNRLVMALQPPQELVHSEGTKREVAYLPYEQLSEYSALAEDWIRCSSVKFQCMMLFSHLINITGLHLLIYSLNRAKQILGHEEKAKFVLEIVSPKKTVVREISSDVFSENNTCPELP